MKYSELFAKTSISTYVTPSDWQYNAPTSSLPINFKVASLKWILKLRPHGARFRHYNKVRAIKTIEKSNDASLCFR